MLKVPLDFARTWWSRARHAGLSRIRTSSGADDVVRRWEVMEESFPDLANGLASWFRRASLQC